ncbi:hypothetical protein EHQ81_11990 [Leptospira selangorensis]|uniref:Uncharacterized protein n=1 Tax=Leptospira selangorensis TaxID=2484982 RepID=A0A5F2BW77_9LEPT|nr:hypothetical protein EHQ82_19860 [Leptospira selangorensis]TGM13050.1 hypothetical protein EHQ81_11990 [Leptospira selangorensis]
MGASATLRDCLRNSRSGYATFASVTSFAKQTRAVANVGTPWSLSASCVIFNSNPRNRKL